MSVEVDFSIEKSKNGEETCSFQGKYLHSKYNPSQEAERFSQALTADFSPLCVFILEGALSYCAKFLKNRFPSAQICVIRFTRFFEKYDSNWDKVFYLYDGDIALSERLFNFLGEERLISSLFFDWTPSKQIFQEENALSWSEIKKAVLKARDVLGTRSYFSKRWLKNSLIFASRIKNVTLLNKTDKPVIIASSGPSLGPSLPFLKKNRSSFYLLAVSSAFMPLRHYGLTPDLVLSSDGGFWAKKHLDFPESACKTLFALETESAVPKKILETKKIIPLVYEGSLSKELFDSLKIPYMISERCGTVAGTALIFALNLTTNKVFLVGQDLAPSKGFQHTQPNALENDNARKDFRLKNTETRLTCSRFNSIASLKIYRDWFISNSEYFSKRVFRLSDNFEYEFSLGKIKDISWEEFSRTKAASDFSAQAQNEIHCHIEGEKKARDLLQKKLLEISKTQKFIEEVFPMDSILIKRELSSEKKEILQKKLKEKISELITNCKF